MNVIALALVAALLLSVVFFVVLRRLTRPVVTAPITLEWLEEFSVDRYRPMELLLDETELQFLARQPGLQGASFRKLRAQRRKIFRAYLRNMKRDFSKLFSAAQLIPIHSASDHSDLMMALIRQKALFTLAIFLIEVRLMMHWVGLATVDARSLVGTLRAFHLELRDLSPRSLAA